MLVFVHFKEKDSDGKHLLEMLTTSQDVQVIYGLLVVYEKDGDTRKIPMDNIHMIRERH